MKKSLFKIKKRGASSRRQRQQAQTQRYLYGRYALAILLLLSGAGSAYLVLGSLLSMDRFAITEVSLYGTLKHLEKSRLQPILQRQLGRNFFTLDLAELRQSLLAESWLQQVKIKRSWPNRLHVVVQERQLFARWHGLQSASEQQLVDVQGQLFAAMLSAQERSRWPLLSAQPEHVQMMLAAYQQASHITQRLGLKINRLRLDERQSWSLTLSNNLNVILGRDQQDDDNFVSRLQRLVAIYPTVIAPQLDRIAEIDMRYVDGFSVRWHETEPTEQSLPIMQGAQDKQYDNKSLEKNRSLTAKEHTIWQAGQHQRGDRRFEDFDGKKA